LGSILTENAMRLTLILFLLAAPVYAADIYVATTGSDTPGGGTLAAPFATLAYSHTQSANGDTLILRAGTYTGGVYMTRNNLTVRSHTGEWAIISLPTSTSGQDVTLYFAGSNCIARNLEIVGGYFYCVKIDAGPAIVEDCRIHGSGRDCVKIPAADNVTIRRCEIYNSGVRDPSNAEGIDNVNGDTMLVQDCYIHDIATCGVYPKGGSIGSIIERCLIRNCGQKGISMAQSSGTAFYDTVANPEYYGCRDCVARNNIIENCEGSGIDLEAALRAKVYNNTLINVAKSQQGGIRISLSSFGGSPPDVPCRDCEIRNNIIVLGSASARPMLFMGNNSHAGTLTMSNNRYYKTGGTAVYWWEPLGQYTLNLAGWKTSSGTDSNSTEGDPQVGADWHLLGASPCIGAAMTIAGFSDDYDGNTRSGAWDIGADETGGTALVSPPSAGAIGTGGGFASGNRAPTITVTYRSGPVIQNGPMWYYPYCGYDQPVSGLIISIAVDDADGDPVNVTGTVSNVTFEGILESEFSSASAGVPYNLNPQSGTLTKSSSFKTVILVASDPSGAQTVFTFWLSQGGFAGSCGDKDAGGCTTSQTELSAFTPYLLMGAICGIVLALRSLLRRGANS
jgi:Right handed beta helix region